MCQNRSRPRTPAAPPFRRLLSLLNFFRRRHVATLTDAQRAALAGLVAAARYEIIPLRDVRDRIAALPPGATVTVTASPAKGLDATIELAADVSARGHDAVPHLAARLVRDRAHLSDLLARLRAAGVRKCFVVGGDGEPVGEFRDGLGLLRGLAEAGHHFDEVGVPGYPEGHPKIPAGALLAALKEKQQYAQRLTTQMSFNPEAVASWVRGIRQEGVTLGVQIGIPGALEVTRLMKVAAQIGVADSARYLAKNTSLIGQLARPGAFGPDAFLEALAPVAADPASGIVGLHVFTMNQVAETAAWQSRMRDRLRPGEPDSASRIASGSRP